MKEFIELCDKQRVLNWQEVFPEMKGIFNELS